jgi:glycosyltransferase involved in cell wall biosynthesis
MKLLRDAKHVEVRIVFCGSHTGEIRQQTFRQVIDLCAQLGVEKQVHYLGYVPDKDISGIYGGSAGLVMPTFFGPTNIPVMEAWAYACPVLTSDIRGIREQVADAGILVDPMSVEALADGMYRLWTDEKLASSLAQRGLQRLMRYTADDFRQRLTDILEEAKARVRQAQSARVSI